MPSTSEHPVARHPGLFISCALPPNGLAQLCVQMASALGFEPMLANREAAMNPRNKVFEIMKRCDASLFVADLDDGAPSAWQSAELGIALSLDHKLGFVYSTRTGRTTDLHKPARDIEPLILVDDPTSTEGHVAIASYISSLKGVILNSASEQPVERNPVRYDSAIWSVHVGSSGTFSYSCRFECVAEVDGVGDLDHWMNANPRLPDPIESRPRSVELVENGDPDRQLVPRPPSGDDRVFRFGWEINPPLRRGDRLLYEYRVTPNNGPITPDWWRTRHRPIRHMYNVTLPMHGLIICVNSQLGIGFSAVDARAYVGQRTDAWTENLRESARSQTGVRKVYVGKSATASVEISQPLMGHTYTLEWSPDWRS